MQNPVMEIEAALGDVEQRLVEAATFYLYQWTLVVTSNSVQWKSCDN